jgi:hypothetical protein
MGDLAHVERVEQVLAPTALPLGPVEDFLGDRYGMHECLLGGVLVRMRGEEPRWHPCRELISYDIVNYENISVARVF